VFILAASLKLFADQTHLNKSMKLPWQQSRNTFSVKMNETADSTSIEGEETASSLLRTELADIGDILTNKKGKANASELIEDF
jgi:hypothetical protein